MEFNDDGFAGFDGAANYGTPPGIPQNIPDPTTPNAVAAGLWGDHEIFYDETANQGVTGASWSTIDGVPLALMVEFDDIEPVGGGTPVGDFEIMIYNQVNDAPDNWEIIFAYDNLNNLPALATIGVENPGGSEATAFLNLGDPSTAISDGLAVCFDLGGCRDYWLLDSGTQISPRTVSARKAIYAGGDFSVGAGGDLKLNTSPGGFVRLYPGFSVADTARLNINTNAAVCQ